MYIYKITNLKTNKCYVGKTINTIQKRWYQHCKNAEYGVDTYLYRSMRKYGINNFKISVVEFVNTDINLREMYWINQINPEYNMTAGGDGGWINDQTGNRWKVKDSSKMGKTFKEGNNHSETWRLAVEGGNNYQCLHWIYTPWGRFDNYKSAILAAKKMKSLGEVAVITDRNTLKKYCESDIVLSREGRRTHPAWRGRSTRELGFYIEEKKDVNV